MVAEAVTKKSNTGILRKDLRLYPAGQPRQWTLHDPVADRYYRLGETEYQILSRMHDNMSVDQLGSLLTASGSPVSSQEITALLGFLSVNGLMQPVYGKSHQRIREMHEKMDGMQRQRLLGIWLSMRFPLIRPERFLKRTWPLLCPLLRPEILWILCALSVTGYCLLLLRLPQLTAVFHQSLSPHGLLKYGLAIVAVKILHELAHAYAAHWAGVPVRVMGVGLIVFLPRLYTDVTDSWRIGDRRKRMLIDGAGMAVELVLGGIASLVWATTGPGTLNAMCYYIVTVSALNTMLINGNPLLRFDGYYLLMDATGIDNLSTRANSRIKNLLRNLFFGIPVPPREERGGIHLFLVLYGIISNFYRVVLYSGLIFFITSSFFPLLGFMFTGLGIHLLAVRPLIQEGRLVMRQKAHMQHGRVSVSLLLLLGMIALFLVPLPWNLEIPCVVKSERTSTLYVETPGYVDTWFPEGSMNESVQLGDVLYTLDNPLLQLKLAETQARIGEQYLEIDQLESQKATLGAAKIKQQQLRSLETAEAEIRRKLDALTVRAPIQGVLVWYKPEDMEKGRWLPQGTELGEVSSFETRSVQAFLPEMELSGIREGQKAEIILPDQITKISGLVQVIRRTPQKTLPPSPLVDIFGGPIPVKRQGAELIPQHSWYEVLVRVDSENALTPGRSGVVKLERYRSLGASLGRLLLEIVRRDVF